MGTLFHFIVRRLAAPLSSVGLVFGSAAFVASLTPSLISRTSIIQGATAGLAFAAAYALGTLFSILWCWLGLKGLPERHQRSACRFSRLVSVMILLIGLALAPVWQETVRQALGLPEVETERSLIIAAMGFVVALSLILIGRLFRLLKDSYAWPMRRVFPERLSFLVAALFAAWSFWAIGNGFLLDAALRGMDATYRRLDGLMPSDQMPPSDPQKTGSAASLIPWSSLGREGQAHILGAPSVEEVIRVAGGAAKTPLRVYVGLNSAETPRARAALALAELIRVGAFDRKLLVLSTPTGTGWVDPAAMIPLEILHRGDVATVSVQYSYLPSWLSLLVEPDYGHDTARALFDSVYQHWHSLPKTARPRFFLFGLSLGAMNSDLSSDMVDIVGDPYDGAFWAGPPFTSRIWNQVKDTRAGGTPWLPQAHNPKTFRFITNTQQSQLYAPNWGPLRILYLQYASDPIVFFEKQSWRRRPAWLTAPNAPDVSPHLRWLPGVTFLQLIVDMITATGVPKGVGHSYAASDYVAGWVALTGPVDWDEAKLEGLNEWLDGKGL